MTPQGLPPGEGAPPGRGRPHRGLLPDPSLLPGHAAAAVAAADRARLAEGVDLMSVASTALATTCVARLREVSGRVSGARVVLLVGAGNNGGDALYAGALLRRRGAGVTALLCATTHHEDAARELRRAGGELVRLARPDEETGEDTGQETGEEAGGATGGLPGPAVAMLRRADLVVDGLLGIGSTGAARGGGGRLLAWLTGDDGGPVRGRRPRSVVACDLPSGLDAATGLPAGPVLAADVTVTFGAAKTGLLLPWARPLVGSLQVVDLGLAPHLPATARLHRLAPTAPGSCSPLLTERWPWPWRQSHKYSRGVLGVAAGDPAYPGAAVLTAAAAVQAGTGMVRLVPPSGAPEVGRLVLGSVPELVVQSLQDVGRVQAWVVGPGTGGGPDARAEHVLTAATEPAVVDAGALGALAAALTTGTLHRPARLLLTPHAGELARLREDLGLEPVEDDPWAQVRAVAASTGATVLLKGPDTLVVDPDGTTVVVPGGPPSLATAGAGDVLAGLLGSLLAAGCAPMEAGVLGAHLHAVTGHAAAGRGPLRASALVGAVARVLAGAHPDAWDHG